MFEGKALILCFPYAWRCEMTLHLVDCVMSAGWLWAAGSLYGVDGGQEGIVLREQSSFD